MNPVDPAGAQAPARCDACPAVSCQLKVLLVAGDDPPEHFIDEDEDGQQVMGKADDGWCAALDRGAMRCGIYDRRPLVCREFDMDGEDCRREREDWRRIAISLR
jgi:Fe-S-cluster containining protein